MEFANRSSGGSSQHHGNSCPYFDQSPHRPAAAQPESFHGHAFSWQPAAAYHQWSAPPLSTLEFQHSAQGLPQLRMPQASAADHYRYLPGALPPPHQQSPAGFQSGSAADASYGTSGAMSSPGAQASASTAPNNRTRSFDQAHNSRLPGQAPGPPSHPAQPPPQFPSPPQQTQHSISSHTPSSYSTETPQHPLPPHHPSFPPHSQAQSASQQSTSGNSLSSSSSPADTPSLAGHQRLQHQHQQYLSAMSSSNQQGPGGVPSQHGHPPYADSAAQYTNGQGQSGQQEQRQMHNESQAHRPHYQRPPNPSVAYPPMASQPINIPPPHLPSLLNPNHMQHHYGHGYVGAYSENIPPNPRDLPRHAPPSAVPTTSDYRRRTVSSRSTRRSGAHAPPVSSERDRDIDDESSSTSSVGSSIDNAVNTGSMRHAANDRQLRAAQLFRGSVTTRKVASSSAIASLQSVDIESLSAAERSCVICYNDYGTETPEGVREAPLRLPKCKHVFGDHCIKKWFEESDSCPYCRTKVPSDLRFMADGRALMELMRARGGTLPVDLNGPISQEAILRLVATHGAAGYDMPGGIRRSPPTESSEQRRRIRPRHSGSMSSPPRADGSNGSNSRPLSFGAVPSSSSSNNPSSPRERHPFGDHARAQRDREWANLHMSRAHGRPSQSQAPPNMYSQFPWDEPFGDPNGRLPMPNTGGLPPMGGMPAHNTIQHGHSAAPPFQPNPTAFPYIQSLGLRAQREAASAGLPNPSHPTGGFHATEVNATAVETDTPMPDRAPVP